MRLKHGRILALLLALCLLAAVSAAETAERVETSRDKVSAREWVDGNGKRTAGPEGWSRVEYIYKNGATLPTTESYFDAEGKPFVTAEGYAKVVRTYGKNNTVTEEAFYGADDKPTVSAKGYASAKFGYTSAGDLRSEYYYDEKGDKIIVPSLGYACAVREFKGRTLYRETLMDADKNPVDGAAGYAVLENTLNKKYHILESCYTHADGTPAFGPEGWHRAEYENDRNGNPKTVNWFTENGTPWINGEGASGYAFTYDKKEREKTRQLIRDGQPVMGLHGWSSREYEYDTQGRLISTRYRDLKGQLVSLGSGCAYVRTVYTKDGSGSVQTRYDTAEQPLDQGGYVSLGCDWDKNGRITRTYFLDEKGKATANAYGVFSTEYGYDSKGRIVTTAFFDGDHAPMNGPEGWASCRDELDGNGFILTRTCYGADGTVVRVEKYQYDALMNRTGVEVSDGTV